MTFFYETIFKLLGPSEHLLNDVDLHRIKQLWIRLKDRKFKQFSYNKGNKKFIVKLEQVKVNPDFEIPSYNYDSEIIKVCKVSYCYKIELGGKVNA